MKLSSNDVVLFTGDSITEGARFRSMDLNHNFGHGWQYTVASTLALENCSESPKFLNKAYSGYTITGLLETWQEDVIDNKPTYVFIMIGINDSSQGFFNNLTTDETADRYNKDLREAVNLTKTALPGVKFIFLEPFYFPLERTGSYAKTPNVECEKPFARPDNNDTDELVNYRLEVIEKLKNIVIRIAKENDFLYIPLKEKFTEYMSKSSKEYFTWDGVHPTIAGHALIAETVLESI